MAGQHNTYAFKFLLHLLILSQKHILGVKKVVWGGLGVVWWWFGANMAGQRNKNAFKFLLILLILSLKHIFGVKKVVWDGLDVVWGGLEVVWGVSTDPNSVDRYAITCDVIAYHSVQFVSICVIYECQSGIDFFFTSERTVYFQFYE